MNVFTEVFLFFGSALGLMALSCCCLYALQRCRERQKTVSPESFPDEDLEANITVAADSQSEFSHESSVALEEKTGGRKMNIRQVRYVV